MIYDFTMSYCLVSLSGIAVLWFYFVSQLRRDAYRASIRRIRDDLFDYMWQNGYDFDTRAYRAAREDFNALLRVSNRLSPTLLVVSTAASLHRQGRSDTERMRVSLPVGPLGDRVRAAYTQAADETFRFVFRTGLVGLFVSFVLLILRCIHKIDSFEQYLRTVIREAMYRAANLIPSPPDRRSGVRAKLAP